jgi:hypothetical protein
MRSWLGVGRLRLLLPAVFVFLLALPATVMAAPGWYFPVNVSPTPTGSQAFNPDVAVDGVGRAVAVWVKNDGSNDRVQVSVREAGALNFGTTQTISPAGENAFEPKVANAPTGESVVVWTNTSTNRIQSAYKAAVTNLFGNVVSISTAAAFHPTVSMDPQGNVQALWVRTVGSNTIIEGAFQPTGGAFGPVEQISENGFVSDVPDVAAEQNGGASAVWTRFDGATAVVQTSARRELNYPRPGGGSPYRVPLVPEFKACTSPNSTHIAPLNSPSCTPAALDSTVLTTGNAGAGNGNMRFDAVPGITSTQADEADLKIAGTLADVRCTAAGPPGCLLAGDDYTGQVLFATSMRITDLANGGFQDDPGTVQDTEFSVPVTCVINPLATVGSTCSFNTTADTLVPNYIKERKRTIIQAFSVAVEDAGPDGNVTPPSGTCPAICGNGDEKVFQRQGVFLP